MVVVAHMGEIRNAHRILNRKYERKKPLRRTRCRRDDNIKIVLTTTESMCTGFIWLRIWTSYSLL
jgi:hypothetical protein